MTPDVLRIDDVRPVLAAIRERGVRVDPLFAGECRQLFGNVGTRLRYCRKTGRTIDEVGELLWDRGFTTRRVSTVECLDLLETLFTPGVGTRVAQPSNRAIEQAAAKARSTRLRKFECLTIAEWTRKIGGSENTIRERLRNGWSVAEAVTRPLRGRR